MQSKGKEIIDTKSQVKNSKIVPVLFRSSRSSKAQSVSVNGLRQNVKKQFLKVLSYFNFIAILKKMYQITVPQLFTSVLNVEGH